MIERPRYSHLATELLARTPAEPSSRPSADARARTIEALASELAAIRRRERRRRSLAIAGIAAAFVISISAGVLLAKRAAHGEYLVWARPLSGEAALVRDGHRQPLDGRSLIDGDRVETAVDAKATLTLSTGTHVAIGGATDVRVNARSRHQSFELARGELTFEVAKLGRDERLTVRTVDAEVEVRGTIFSVSTATPSPSCGEGSPTRLVVREGVVALRVHGKELRVAAGEQWPIGCDAMATASRVPTRDEASSIKTDSTTADAARANPKSVTGDRAALTTTPSTPLSPSSIAAPASTLAAENDLFARATEARRQGDTARALRLYERFLATYPTGRLAESAEVERMRLLVKSDSAAARAAARRYLDSHAAGFAADEARQIVGNDR